MSGTHQGRVRAPGGRPSLRPHTLLFALLPSIAVVDADEQGIVHDLETGDQKDGGGRAGVRDPLEHTIRSRPECVPGLAHPLLPKELRVTLKLLQKDIRPRAELELFIFRLQILVLEHPSGLSVLLRRPPTHGRPLEVIPVVTATSVSAGPRVASIVREWTHILCIRSCVSKTEPMTTKWSFRRKWYIFTRCMP